MTSNICCLGIISVWRFAMPRFDDAIDATAQKLLKELCQLVDEVYPKDDLGTAKDRAEMLAQLKPYQDRQASLILADRSGLRKLQDAQAAMAASAGLE